MGADQMTRLIEDAKRAVSRAGIAAGDAEDAASDLATAAEELAELVNPTKVARRNGDAYRAGNEIHDAHGGVGAARYCEWPGCRAFRTFVFGTPHEQVGAA